MTAAAASQSSVSPPGASHAGSQSAVTPRSSMPSTGAASSAGTSKPATVKSTIFPTPEPSILLGADVASAPFVIPSSASQPPLVAPGCFKVTAGRSASIEVCGPEPDPAWMKYANIGTAVLALVVSAIAVVVAHKTFAFMRRQDRQARTDSVRDEYWLRTVVSPTCIEPFQAFVGALRAELPGAAAPSVPPSVAELQAFYKSATLKFNDFSLKFRTLALIDLNLSAAVEVALQDLEDHFARYMSDLTSHVQGATPTPPVRSEMVARLTDGMLGVFKLVQDHQVRSGDDPPSQRRRWWDLRLG